MSSSVPVGSPRRPFADQEANHVLAGPASGPDAQPEFRRLTLPDLPTIPSFSLIGNVLGSAGPPQPLDVGPGLMFGGLGPEVRFGDSAGTVCEGNDPRLSDARTPLTHAHAIADVTGLSAALDARPLPLWRVLTANQVVGDLAGTWQNVFQSGVSACPVEANTIYEVEALIFATFAAATISATAVQLRMVDTSGVVGEMPVLADGRRSASGGLGVAGVVAWVAPATTVLAMGSGADTTGNGFVYRQRGLLITSASGTITPQFRFSPNAPGSTCTFLPGTSMVLRRLGASSSGGNW